MPASSNVLRAWTFEPGVVAALGALAAVYVAAWLRVRHRPDRRGAWRPRDGWAFVAGWLALAAALVSPIDALSESLFGAHMVQHELLMVVAAPLLVLSRPGALIAAALAGTRAGAGAASALRSVRAPARVVTAPAAVWLLHAVALWAWHVPALFNAALASDPIHALQHLSFFGTAVLFWWGLVQDRYDRMQYGAAVLYVFTTAVHSGVLGALLTLSPWPWYPAYATTTAAFGLTPLEDQQLGGLIMWVPAGAIYVAVGLAFFAAWLGALGGGRVAVRAAE